jgi:hypothetical protein
MLSVANEPVVLSVILKNVVMLGPGAQARGLTLQMFVSAKKLPRDKQSSLFSPEA